MKNQTEVELCLRMERSTTLLHGAELVEQNGPHCSYQGLSLVCGHTTAEQTRCGKGTKNSAFASRGFCFVYIPSYELHFAML